MILSVFIVLAAAPIPQQCREIRYTADGEVTERMVDAEAAEGAASASAHSSGAGAAHSSVAVSSHNNGAGRSSASSSSNGRSVTVTHGPEGCTITIDERDPQHRSEQ